MINFGVNKPLTPIYGLTGERREGLQPYLSPLEEIYAALKSSFVAVLADREAIADGLNPLTISHTARVSSFKPIGMLNNMISVFEKGSIWRNIVKKTATKCNVIAMRPQPESHRGISLD